MALTAEDLLDENKNVFCFRPSVAFDRIFWDETFYYEFKNILKEEKVQVQKHREKKKIQKKERRKKR